MTRTTASHARAQFHRLLISEQDFRESLEFLRELSSSQGNAATRRALMFASVVSYARPFTDNSQQKTDHSQTTPTYPGRWRSSVKKEFHELHELLIEVRHKALAHSSHRVIQPQVLFVSGSIYQARMEPFDVTTAPIELKAFQELCLQHLQFCDSAKSKLLPLLSEQ